jgi:hypothetical protein
MPTISPIYHGDTSFSEVPGWRLTKKRGISDHLTRIYHGNAALIPAFIAANPVLGSLGPGVGVTYDSVYPWMVLTEMDIGSAEGPDGKATLTFDGYNFIFGSLVGNLQTSGKWVKRQATLTTDNTADPPFQVTYSAPILTYAYVTGGLVRTPIYQGAAQAPNTITVLDVVPLSPALPSYVMQGTLQYAAYAICEDFSFQQKGQNYDYKESWIVTVAPKATVGNSPGQIVIGGLNTPPDF